MRILTTIFAGLLAALAAQPSQAQTFPPYGEYYHDFEDNHFTSCGGGYMVGIHARTGAWFNSIGALCATYDPVSRQLVPSAPGQVMGFNAGGGVHEKRCPQNQAIEYLAFSAFETKNIDLGVPGDAFTMLDEIVFRCRAITAQAESVNDPVIGMTSDDPLEIADMNTTKPYPSGPNVNPGFTHKQRCVDGRLANGLSVAVPGAFDQPPKYPMDGVNGIGLQCAVQPTAAAPPPPPPPPPPPVPIDTAGGASFPLGPQGGGKQIDLYCPIGQAMVGLYGSGKGNNMDRVDLQCAHYLGRTWSGLPIQGGTLGAGAFAMGTMLKCTSPNAVTALDGDVSSYGGIARLRLRCGSEITSDMGRGAPATMETWTHGVITCGPNNIARGIYGWLDGAGAVKSFGLHCLPASAFSGGPSGGGSASGGGSSGGGSGGAGSGGGSATGVTLNDFAGTWKIVVNTGYSYTMQLFVSGGVIRGSYDNGRANGQVSNGMLSGNTLMMDLSQSAVIVGTGKGTFRFTDPVHLQGTWSVGPYSGTWQAVHL